MAVIKVENIRNRPIGLRASNAAALDQFNRTVPLDGENQSCAVEPCGSAGGKGHLYFGGRRLTRIRIADVKHNLSVIHIVGTFGAHTAAIQNNRAASNGHRIAAEKARIHQFPVRRRFQLIIGCRGIFHRLDREFATDRTGLTTGNACDCKRVHFAGCTKSQRCSRHIQTRLSIQIGFGKSYRLAVGRQRIRVALQLKAEFYAAFAEIKTRLGFVRGIVPELPASGQLDCTALGKGKEQARAVIPSTLVLGKSHNNGGVLVGIGGKLDVIQHHGHIIRIIYMVGVQPAEIRLFRNNDRTLFPIKHAYIGHRYKVGPDNFFNRRNCSGIRCRSQRRSHHRGSRQHHRTQQHGQNTFCFHSVFSPSLKKILWGTSRDRHPGNHTFSDEHPLLHLPEYA